MFVSSNAFVIVLHVIALLLALAAAWSGRASVGGRRVRFWHLGWLAVAVLVFTTLLADLGVFH